MSAAVEFVEDLGGAVVDLVEDVGGAITDAVDWVVDEVIDPVVTTVGNVIDGMMDDPIKSIAMIAASIYAPWAIPLIEGADIAISGGDIGDVLEGMAKSYVMQAAGQYVGQAAGAWAGEAAGSLEYADEAARAAAMKTAAQVVGSAAGNAAVAVVAGRDPLEAMLIGGVSAAVPAVLGQSSAFQGLPKAAQNVISAGVTSALTGANPTASMINGLIAATDITSTILKESGADQFLKTDAQRAIVSDILMGTISAAVSGGNGSNVLQAALMKAGSKALGELVTDGFKTVVDEVSGTAQAAREKAALLEENQMAQQTAVDGYNQVRDTLSQRNAELGTLKTGADAAMAAFNANKNADTKAAAEAAIEQYNTYARILKSDYDTTYKPQLEQYGAELDALKVTHATASGDYEKLVQSLATKTDKLSEALDPIYGKLQETVVKAVDPNFDAEQYRKLNGLGADVDAYEHYLDVGQREGFITNDKDKVIADKAAAFEQATGVKLPEYIIDNAKANDNATRDAAVSNYVDNTLVDMKTAAATKTAAQNAVLDSYAKAGYSQAQINYLIDSGKAGTYVNEIMSKQQAGVEQLRDYAKAVYDSAGPDSAEYKTAYKAALDGMAAYGGYGVVKDSSGSYISTQNGKLDPDTLVPVTKSHGYFDPVTGMMHVFVYGVGDSQKYAPLSDLPKEDISALWAKGRSANPPTGGGGSIFGDGSGVSSSMFASLQLVAKDDGSGDAGAKMFDGGTGFALIAYSDGTARAIKKDTGEVIWLEPAEAAKILKEVPQVPPAQIVTPTEVIPAPPKPSVDLTKPPLTLTEINKTLTAQVAEQIADGQTAAMPSAATSPTTDGGAAAPPANPYVPQYTWNTLSSQATSDGTTGGNTNTGGGATSGGTSGGTTGGTSGGTTGTPAGLTPAQQTQRMGNINSMMGMLAQSPDAAGQQVTVKQADPAKIGYAYDWNSIFANPSQEKMFVTPYAQGGAVRSDLDDVNDELLKLLKG